MGALLMNQDPVIAALEQQVDCYRKLARLALTAIGLAGKGSLP